MCKIRYVENEIPSKYRLEYNEEPPQVKYIFQSNRKPTDRYWTLLFVVVFIIWIASWNYHIKNNFTIKALSKTPPELTYNATDYTNNIITNTTSELISFSGIFKIFTCDIIFLNAHYETSGSILIWVNAFFCVCLIFYSFISMPSDNIFCGQIIKFGCTFLTSLAFYRISIFFMIANVVPKIQCIYKSVFWVMPEVIFIIILATTKSFKTDDQDHLKLNYNCLKGYTSLIESLGLAILKILISLTIVFVHQLNWDDPLYYVILGATLYLSLTLFYFISMVISCGTSIVLHSPVKIVRISLFLQSLYIIGRYNFGTVCYHATLMFPRIHALILMNETEFRKASNFSIAQRFYLAQCKFQNVSSTFTAVLGDNHSESMRELMRLSTSNYATLKHFQGFTEICSSISLLLICTNSLLITLLWSQEIIVDPDFSMGTWWMILIVMCNTYMHMRVFDAVSDTFWLHEDEENTLEF